VILRLLVVVLAVFSAQAETRPVVLFYMTDSPDSVRSFLAHSGKIGILVPTWYSVDANGLVYGGTNPTVIGGGAEAAPAGDADRRQRREGRVAFAAA